MCLLYRAQLALFPVIIFGADSALRSWRSRELYAQNSKEEMRKSHYYCVGFVNIGSPFSSPMCVATCEFPFISYPTSVQKQRMRVKEIEFFSVWQNQNWKFGSCQPKTRKHGGLCWHSFSQIHIFSLLLRTYNKNGNGIQDDLFFPATAIAAFFAYVFAKYSQIKFTPFDVGNAIGFFCFCIFSHLTNGMEYFYIFSIVSTMTIDSVLRFTCVGKWSQINCAFLFTKPESEMRLNIALIS